MNFFDLGENSLDFIEKALNVQMLFIRMRIKCEF